MGDISARRDETFRGLYHENFDALLGYALRRTARPEDAADVVADTFLVAWRRQRDVPPGEQARLWLYGVARRTLANQRRGDARRTHLGERLGAELALVVPDLADDVTTHHLLRQALDQLPDRDREVLQLSEWEGLQPREIAVVLGTSAVAARARLSRARSRLRRELGHDPRVHGHVPSNHPPLATKEER